MRRRTLSLCLSLALVPVALIAWYRWDSTQNHGLSFGYYGDFNRVRGALTHIPGVMVTRDWANNDVTLEEFGFDITTPTGQAMTLDFQESDTTRKLSGEPLNRELTEKIQKKVSLSNGSK